MGAIIFSIVLAVIFGVILAFVWRLPGTDRGNGDFWFPKWAKLVATVVCGVLALIPIMVATITVVPTRTVGIVVNYGKPVGTLSNGLHLKAPWSKIEKMDTTIQIDTPKFKADDKEVKGTQVRIGDDTISTVESSVSWRIVPAEADSLWKDYKSFDRVRDVLVMRELNVALSNTFATYDPAVANGGTESALPGLAAKVKTTLQDRVGDRIEVQSVNVPVIRLSQKTEERISQLQQQRTMTEISKENEKTAEAQARANEKLKSSVSNDPNVIVANCINGAIEKGISPLGCWPGSSAMPTVPVR